MFGPKPPEGEKMAPADYREFFKEHLDKSNEDDYQITVYVIKPPSAPNQKNLEYVETYYNKVPPLEELGLRCGGVSLKFFGRRKSTNEKHYFTEHLHESWNLKKAIYEKKMHTELGGAPGPQPLNGHGISQLREVMGLMKEMKDLNGESAQSEIYTKALSAVYEANARLVEDSIKQTTRLKLAALKPPEIQDEKKESDPAPKWGPAEFMEFAGELKKFGVEFMNSGPIKQYLMKKGLVKSEAYDVLKHSPKLIEQLYDIGKNDPDIGEEKIISVLEKLGIDVEKVEPEPEKESAKEPAKETADT